MGYVSRTVAGGGEVCEKYVEGGKEVTPQNPTTKIVAESLDLVGKIMDALQKEPSEKTENEWKKRKQELLDAINCGDIDTIRRITAIFSGL